MKLEDMSFMDYMQAEYEWKEKQKGAEMSEHKFKVGDEVRVMGIPTSIGVLAEINPDRKLYPYKIKLDNGDFLMARTDELEPVSYHIMKADEIAELFKETEEKDKKEHTLPNPADLMSKMDEDTQRLIEKVEEKANNPIHHWYDNREYTAYLKGWKIGRNESYEAGYKAGFDEGFIVGMKAVIRNVTRFLKEIQP